MADHPIPPSSGGQARADKDCDATAQYNHHHLGYRYMTNCNGLLDISTRTSGDEQVQLRGCGPSHTHGAHSTLPSPMQGPPQARNNKRLTGHHESQLCLILWKPAQTLVGGFTIYVKLKQDKYTLQPCSP
jgi:hypothetical protein